MKQALTLADRNLVYRYDLQGLRAIAVLLVILTHAGINIVPGGFVGVDVFFVLSGYLITRLLLRELETNRRIDFVQFYARRLKRLFPAMVFMLIVSSSLAVWLLSRAEAHLQLASLPFALTWTSNLYFTFKTVDYFDELSNQDLFLHTWSLGTEEQFYLLWPALLLFYFRLKRKPEISDQGAFSLILPGIVVALIISIVISLNWTIYFPQAAFYLMPSRIWQFSLGAIVYLMFRNDSFGKDGLNQHCNDKFYYSMLSVGLILIIGSAILLHPAMGYPGLWSILPSLGASIIIAAGAGSVNRGSDPLSHPILVWLGDRSYSLYLWHWPIIMVGFSMGFKGQVLPTLIMILLSLLASILSFRLIEFPFWKGRWRHSKSRHIILISLLIMVAMIGATYHGFRQLLPDADTTSNQWIFDLPAIYNYPCDAWYFHSQLEPCLFGAETAPKTVVFIGDSIGAQWFSMIPEIFPEPSWRTIVLTKSACPMVDEDFYYTRIRKIYQVCSDWRQAALDWLDRIDPDVLIIGNSATYNFDETQWIEGTSRILSRLRDTQATIVVIPGTPSLSFDGPSCVARHISPDGVIEPDKCLTKQSQYVDLVSDYLERAVNRFSNVYMLKLNDLVCPQGNCYAINKQGVVVFRDSQHLTDNFVRTQIPFIRERLNSILENRDRFIKQADSSKRIFKE